jgi:primosomal protein N' (replication factor Y)
MLNHYAIQFARNHDYKGFYQQEIKYRQELGYPPFRRIVNLKYSADTLATTTALAREITLKLRRARRGLFDITGPAPAPIAKIKRQYRWQSLLKIDPVKDPGGKRTKEIIDNVLMPYLRLKESNLKVIVDVDPQEML